MAAFAVAALFGSYLAVAGGMAILVIGLFSLLFGYLYSMGPKPLSMTPLGEGLVITFFGVAAVSGTELLHTGAASIRGIGLGLVMGFPAAAVLLVNNHRDRRTDYASGRRTLAILLGEQGAKALYGLLLIIAAAGMAVWLAARCGGALWVGIPLLAAAGFLSLRMWSLPVSAALNGLLPKTALFQLILVVSLYVAPALCSA
jgi:1,4-dihydroxy-2-naphthoate octaprenyltransferase